MSWARIYSHVTTILTENTTEHIQIWLQYIVHTHNDSMQMSYGGGGGGEGERGGEV